MPNHKKPAQKGIFHLLNFIGDLNEVRAWTNIEGIGSDSFCAKNLQFCKKYRFFVLSDPGIHQAR